LILLPHIIFAEIVEDFFNGVELEIVELIRVGLDFDVF
jgi:hypothetical protein